MVKRTGPTNLALRALIKDLKKTSKENKVKIWRRVAEDLLKPSRQRRMVNVGHINKKIKDGEIALVPGKVLSEGILNKKVTVAAFQFSDSAKNKINKIGKALTLKQLLKENPKGSKVRILG